MISVNKTRRRFLDIFIKGGATALLTFIIYPVYKFLMPPISREPEISQLKMPFGLNELIKDEKKFRIFRFGRTLGILFVAPNGDIKALSAICTHLQCTVQYRKDLEIIWCACHNGRYDLDGRNISGPPPSPLEQYAVHVNKSSDEIFVSKK